MKKQIALCASLVMLGGIGIARAQPAPVYVGPDAGLPPYEIVASVRSAGLVPLTRPVRRGPVYVVAATDRAGRHLNVIVDAHRGDVLSIKPAFAGQIYGAPSARILTVPPAGSPTVVYAPRGDGPPPIPPRTVPYPHLANAPAATGSVPDSMPAQAGRTPLPRPRPAAASATAAAADTAAPAQPPAASAPAPAAPAQDNAPAKSDGPTLVPVAPLD